MMHRLPAFGLLVGSLAILALPLGESPAQAPAKTDRRYNVEYDPDNYSQKTAKEALSSVIKAMDGRKIDYLLAQLADPSFVDKRVQAHGGNFKEFVRQTAERLNSDPTLLRELKRFANEGMWEEADDVTTVRLKDVKARAVFLKKIENRWYLEDRQKPEAKEKEKEKEK